MFNKINLFKMNKKIISNIKRQLSEEEFCFFERLTQECHLKNKNLNYYHKVMGITHVKKDLFLDVLIDFYKVTARILKVNCYENDNPLFKDIFQSILKVNFSLYKSLLSIKEYNKHFIAAVCDIYFGVNSNKKLQTNKKNIDLFFSHYLKNEKIKSIFNQNILKLERTSYQKFFDSINQHKEIMQKINNF